MVQQNGIQTQPEHNAVKNAYRVFQRHAERREMRDAVRPRASERVSGSQVDTYNEESFSMRRVSRASNSAPRKSKKNAGSGRVLQMRPDANTGLGGTVIARHTKSIETGRKSQNKNRTTNK